MSRRLRRSIIFLAILGVLFAGVNVLVARIADEKIGEAIKKELRLKTAPEVHIGGFPVLIHILFGDLPSVTFDARDFTIQGLQVAHAHAELTDLHASNILDTSKLAVRVHEAIVVAIIDGASIQSYVRARDPGTSVSLGSDAVTVSKRARIGGGSHVVRARGRIKLGTNTLSFVARSITVDGKPPPQSLREAAVRIVSFSVGIPSLPGGIHADSLVVVHDALRLTGSLRDKTFRLGTALAAG